jgi:hypothetical protein
MEELARVTDELNSWLDAHGVDKVAVDDSDERWQRAIDALGGASDSADEDSERDSDDDWWQDEIDATDNVVEAMQEDGASEAGDAGEVAQWVGSEDEADFDSKDEGDEGWQDDGEWSVEAVSDDFTFDKKRRAAEDSDIEGEDTPERRAGARHAALRRRQPSQAATRGCSAQHARQCAAARLPSCTIEHAQPGQGSQRA